MESELNFSFPLPAGLHARPASMLAEMISGFAAEVSFANLRNGKQANGRSPLAMVTTDTRAGDPCRFHLAGDDAEEGRKRLENYLRGSFLEKEEAFENIAARKTRTLSRALLATGLKRFARGRAICGGIAEGDIVRLEKIRPAPSAGGKAGAGKNGTAEDEAAGEKAVVDIAAETKNLGRALGAAAQHYRGELAATTGAAAAILKAQLSLLEDDTLKKAVLALVSAGAPAAEAVSRGIDDFKRKILASENGYLHARALDLEDIREQVVAELAGRAPEAGRIELSAPAILLAPNLTPRQFLSLDRSRLAGLVLGEAGQTSHTVILARSCNVPTLIDAPAARLRGFEGRAILDAQAGILINEDSPGLRKYYAAEKQKLARIAARQAGGLEKPARTADGFTLEIGANISSAAEAAPAFRLGADGIGLFRTELLFADRDEAPDEEEQYLAYAQIVREARGRPVIIRTLDIGGDKPAPYLPLPRENNPFLGNRGVRLYREHAGLITTQLRALWRASFHGPARVMLPMVSCVEEARDSKALLERVGRELRREGFGIGASLPLGLMLEVPSVAFMLPELCEVADFFSVGTNDLMQYFLAADRENKAVESLHSPLHPSFLRLLKKLADEARARGRWIGLCGGMAENLQALPLLLGMGFDEISIPAAKIPAVKSAVAKLRRGDCETLLRRALASRARDEIEPIVAAGATGREPLLEAALVDTEAGAATKLEAIRALANTLEIAGRTSEPDELEEALWRREESYSTGFGSGFALPHCKSNHLSGSSIAVLRLRHPVDWGSLDGIPVDVVICLAVRDCDHGGEHMRNMARLARLVMDETFRQRMRNAPSADALVELIMMNLESAGGPAP